MTLWSLSAYAGSGHGVHDFGKNITQNQSCEHAKLKATKDLIENELGTYISVNDLIYHNNGYLEIEVYGRSKQF